MWHWRCLTRWRQCCDDCRRGESRSGGSLPNAAATVHYVVHKPIGMLSSAHDERGRRSVVSLVDTESGIRLWPAGRLDVDSEGLMVLTNDGEWANRVLHPRYGVEREYAVLVDPMPPREDMDALLAGVELDDGPARLLAIQAALPPPEVTRSSAERGRWLRIRVGEGRKREVRRLFASLEFRSLIDRLQEAIGASKPKAEVAELDLNPVIAGPDGCVAVDARVRLRARPSERALKSW